MPGGIHPPLAVVETWPKANHINPEVRGWGLVAVTTVLSAVAVLAVVARLWARLILQRNAGVDDALIVVSLLVALGMAITICLASKVYKFDHHVWDVPYTEYPTQRQVTFAIEAFYVFSTTLTRLSILCFYRRMAKGTFSTPFLWSVRATIAFVIVYGIIFECTLFFGCSPIQAFWLQVDFAWRADHTYKCIDEGATLLAVSAISLTQDLLTCLLPILLFWKLQLPRRQKIGLAAIFGVGGFLCVTAVLRIYYIHNIFYETYDATWASNNSWLWTSVETLVGIVCASAPALKIFLVHHLNTSGSGSHPYSSTDYKSSSTVPFNAKDGDRAGRDHIVTIGSGGPHKLDDYYSEMRAFGRPHEESGFGGAGSPAKPNKYTRFQESHVA